MGNIKVVIVDDSASVRVVLKQILESDPMIDVIATAADPLVASRLFEKEWPDVIILDVEMPHKDGITFLKEIMKDHPTPVVICSSLTEKNAAITIDAMRAGAVEVLTKPRIGVKDFFNEASMMIIDAVKAASQANLKILRRSSETHRLQKPVGEEPPKRKLTPNPKLSADVILPAKAGKPMTERTERFIAIGASAGGTQAIEEVLKDLPANSPGIVIVQHMPEKFTQAFADRLDRVCAVTVREATDGDSVEQGLVLIAPGNRHMLVNRKGRHYSVAIKDGPPVSRHRPAVDVLFRSVAQHAGKNALGIILTGMGDDGAVGMLEMHKAGVPTIAQNKETCIVFGMPKEAIDRGGVDTVLPLQKIPEAIIRYGSGSSD